MRYLNRIKAWFRRNQSAKPMCVKEHDSFIPTEEANYYDPEHTALKAFYEIVGRIEPFPVRTYVDYTSPMIDRIIYTTYGER